MSKNRTPNRGHTAVGNGVGGDRPGNGHRGNIVLRASKGCRFKNVRFEDVKIYGDALNLLAIDNLDQAKPCATKVEDDTLRDIELVLRRVTVTGIDRGR